MTAKEKDRKAISELHAKYYGNKGKRKDHKAEKIAKHPALKKVAKQVTKVVTVKDLMAQAQKAGIKYFRILSRAELDRVLNLHTETTLVEISKIIEEAKARWKAGWGKEKKQ